MLALDPVSWLMAQQGRPALRARRLLWLDQEGDAQAAQRWAEELLARQAPDGSFAGSLMRTAGTLNLLDDLHPSGVEEAVSAAAEYLIAALEAQPGYEGAREVAPGSLTTPCNLVGFFGPYAARGEPEVMARGADEMNALRELEPLLGPRSPVRGVPRSSLDRAGPSSCYAWGLIPLTYSLEALCRAGYHADPRIEPAIHALLGVQRESGGWCRNLAGHPDCSLHALRALGAHPGLRGSDHAARALAFLLRARMGTTRAFALLEAMAHHELPAAAEIIRVSLAKVAPHQRRDGSFGPHGVERVAAVLQGLRALERISPTERSPGG